MRLIVAATLSLFVLTATDAQAGKVQVKKVKRKAEAKVAKALAKAKKACSNPGLRAPINWAVADKIPDAAFKKIGRTRLNVYGLFGTNATNVVNDLTTLCADADYKGEIRKLRTVQLNPAKLSQTKVKYKLAGSTLKSSVPMYYGSSWSDSSGLRALKKVF